MNSGGRVPETRLLGEGELSADHAWRALRRYGSWRLLRDAFLRFRSGDGFSHARALGLQLCLAAVPLLIALNGLASKLGDPQRAGRVVADTVLALTPGASESLVRQLLTDQGRTRDLGQVALALGLLTAVVALTTAAGQIERGANRIYGVDQDRPAPQKYLRALVLAVMAGVPALVSFLLLVAGGAIGASMQRWYHWSRAGLTTWNLLRWPVSLGLIVVTVSLLFRSAPRRRQPGLSWLMVGAGLATALWWLISLLLAAFVTQSSDFGATYGPLTGVMALLLWANLTGIALFLGIAFTAQLEARRARGSGPALPSGSSCLRTGPTPHPPSARSPQTAARVSEAELEPLPYPGPWASAFRWRERCFPRLERLPRMARTPEEDARTRGVLVVRPVQADDRAEEREASLHLSPSMTAMGGQDDAIAPSARVIPSARCNGSAPPKRSVRRTGAQVRAVAARPLGENRPAQLPAAASQTGRGGNQIAVLAQGPN